MPQGHPANWTPLPSHAGFNFQNLPSLGATIQSYRDVRTRSSSTLLSPPSLFISIPITRVFWKPSRMGWWAPMGWGNNGGNGQLGMLGNLLTGKGTMSGIGMIDV